MSLYVSVCYLAREDPKARGVTRSNVEVLIIERGPEPLLAVTATCPPDSNDYHC